MNSSKSVMFATPTHNCGNPQQERSPTVATIAAAPIASKTQHMHNTRPMAIITHPDRLIHPFQPFCPNLTHINPTLATAPADSMKRPAGDAVCAQCDTTVPTCRCCRECRCCLLHVAEACCKLQMVVAAGHCAGCQLL